MTAVMTTVTISNRKRPRAELRDAIFSAALRLFREQGYAQTSVDEIVAAAGVAKGTFFNFFPTKLDVMKAYYAGVDIEVAQSRRDMAPAAPLDALRAYASSVEAILLREGRLMLELLELVMSDPAMRRMDQDSGAADADEFATFLVRVRDLGLIDPNVDPAKASSAIVDLWSGAVRAWLAHPEEGSLGRLFGERVDMLFHGLGYRS
jgi:AcrR family transcriptional regulator